MVMAVLLLFMSCSFCTPRSFAGCSCFGLFDRDDPAVVCSSASPTLKDHHFHFGYFVVAGAMLLKLRPEFLADQAFRNYVETLSLFSSLFFRRAVSDLHLAWGREAWSDGFSCILGLGVFSKPKSGCSGSSSAFVLSLLLQWSSMEVKVGWERSPKTRLGSSEGRNDVFRDSPNR